MHLTNQYGAPDVLANAVLNDPYTRGPSDISVTTLIGPPRIAALLHERGEHLTEDVADRMHSLAGQIVHGILERDAGGGNLAWDVLDIIQDGEMNAVEKLLEIGKVARGIVEPVPGDLRERRFFAKVSGWTVSGAVDRLRRVPGHTRIDDYKYVGTGGSEFSPKTEWIQQVNCYRWLVAENGIEPPDQLFVHAIYRDWSKAEAFRRSKTSDHYPALPWESFEIPACSLKEIEQYVRERVQLHQEARLELPECTPAERWERNPSWAVVQKGRKRALRLLPTEAEAKAWIAEKKPDEKGISIEHRPGRSIRCEDYCPVARVCDQYWQAKAA